MVIVNMRSLNTGFTSFVNFNVDSYLPCGSRLIKERGKHARFGPVFILGVYFH